LIRKIERRKIMHRIKLDKTTILTIAGVAGVFATAITSAIAGYKYNDETWTFSRYSDKEKVEATIKTFAVPATCAIGTSAAIIANHKLNAKTKAELAAACVAGGKALSNAYESLKKHGDLHNVDSVNDIQELNPEFNPDMECIFYEEFTGREFKSTLREVEEAEKQTAAQYDEEGYISLNGFYDYLGLDPTNAGDIIGWNMSDEEERDFGYPMFYNRFTHDERGPYCKIEMGWIDHTRVE
jgi:hypothetical protein